MYRKLIGLRNELGYTQTDVAKIINNSTKTYCLKEQGKSDFTIIEAKKLMDFFNKNFCELFETNE